MRLRAFAGARPLHFDLRPQYRCVSTRPDSARCPFSGMCSGLFPKRRRNDPFEDALGINSRSRWQEVPQHAVGSGAGRRNACLRSHANQPKCNTKGGMMRILIRRKKGGRKWDKKGGQPLRLSQFSSISQAKQPAQIELREQLGSKCLTTKTQFPGSPALKNKRSWWERKESNLQPTD